MKKYTSPPGVDVDFPAFKFRRVLIFQDGFLDAVDLLLPLGEPVDQFVRERDAMARTQKEAYEEQCVAETRAKDALLEKSPMSLGLTEKSRDGGRASTPADAQREELQLAHAQQLKEATPDQVQVYEWDEPCKLLEQASSTPDRMLRDRDQALFAKLKKLGAFRRIGSGHGADRTLQALRALRNSQPHFGEVVDLIEGSLLLAIESNAAVRLPPILLTGAPGVGKTHFTLEVARALGRSIIRHGFDSSHTGSALLGGDRHWANTEPGVVFKAVCLSECADSVVLLDEIDKAQTSSSNTPLAPLHSLLEPSTAKAVKDISAGITFDASHVFWLATANDLQNIPQTIRSRFRVFPIHAPTAAQAIEMAQAVAASVHERFAAFEAPGRRLVTLLAHLTPREQIQALEDAFVHAQVNGRKHLVHQDFPAHLLKDHMSGGDSNGFLH